MFDGIVFFVCGMPHQSGSPGLLQLQGVHSVLLLGGSKKCILPRVCAVSLLAAIVACPCYVRVRFHLFIWIMGLGACLT
jgi:hypothetical protein